MFGTDGVRGVAGTELTIDLAMKLGQAGAYVLAKSKGKKPKLLSQRQNQNKNPKPKNLFRNRKQKSPLLHNQRFNSRILNKAIQTDGQDCSPLSV